MAADTAFATTVRTERPYLRALCARHLVIPDEAEDAVQDALLRA